MHILQTFPFIATIPVEMYPPLVSRKINSTLVYTYDFMQQCKMYITNDDPKLFPYPSNTP